MAVSVQAGLIHENECRIIETQWQGNFMKFDGFKWFQGEVQKIDFHLRAQRPLWGLQKIVNKLGCALTPLCIQSFVTEKREKVRGRRQRYLYETTEQSHHGCRQPRYLGGCRSIGNDDKLTAEVSSQPSGIVLFANNDFSIVGTELETPQICYFHCNGDMAYNNCKLKNIYTNNSITAFCIMMQSTSDNSW